MITDMKTVYSARPIMLQPFLLASYKNLKINVSVNRELKCMRKQVTPYSPAAGEHNALKLQEENK